MFYLFNLNRKQPVLIWMQQVILSEKDRGMFPKAPILLHFDKFVQTHIMGGIQVRHGVFVSLLALKEKTCLQDMAVDA